MRKVVLTFGLIAGAVLSVMMVVTLPWMDSIGYEKGEIIGYTTMVLAFMMVFFGIKSYRDNVAGGTITFGRAFKVGGLIALIGTLCYVATWQVVSRTMAPDFPEKYAAYAIEKARASGKSAEEIAKEEADMKRFAEWYKNPLVNIGFTFLEPLPVALIITLVSAGVLKRKVGAE
ncbi:MAG TPA: DUF4199 domain-containing protein [Gemmatimonadaceae bacterium]|nr:DUF4199 domain-containing protein [Gemmatimonadaceae bacterium]